MQKRGLSKSAWPDLITMLDIGMNDLVMDRRLSVSSKDELFYMEYI